MQKLKYLNLLKFQLQTLNMTHDIMLSFKDILSSAEWIGEKTKMLAHDKVDAMILRIGYPDFILSDDELNEYYKKVS